MQYACMHQRNIDCMHACLLYHNQRIHMQAICMHARFITTKKLDFDLNNFEIIRIYIFFLRNMLFVMTVCIHVYRVM